MLFRIIKRRFISDYSSPVMLISRKVAKDKSSHRVQVFNVRIAKNNLAFPLLKDTYSVLGSSRCEVFSVLYLKDGFYSLRLLRNSKDIVGSYHILVRLHIYVKECLWD